jgi:hypothetical protein
MVSISAAVSRGSFAKVPGGSFDGHGGITRLVTAARIARAHGRASAKEVSGIGPISPAR